MDEHADVRAADRRRDGVRIGAGLLAFVATVAWFRRELLAVRPLVWPPTDPMAVTLALVVALSLLLPVMIAAAAADTLYDRVVGE